MMADEPCLGLLSDEQFQELRGRRRKMEIPTFEGRRHKVEELFATIEETLQRLAAELNIELWSFGEELAINYVDEAGHRKSTYFTVDYGQLKREEHSDASSK